MQYEQLELPFIEPDFDDPEYAQNVYLDDPTEEPDYWRGRAETAEEELEAANEKLAEAHSRLKGLQATTGNNPYAFPLVWKAQVEQALAILADHK